MARVAGSSILRLTVKRLPMTRPKREEWPRGHCPRTDLQMHPISYQHWVAEAAYFEDRLALCRHHHEQYTEAQHVALRVHGEIARFTLQDAPSAEWRARSDYLNFLVSAQKMFRDCLKVGDRCWAFPIGRCLRKIAGGIPRSRISCFAASMRSRPSTCFSPLAANVGAGSARNRSGRAAAKKPTRRGLAPKVARQIARAR